MAAEKDQAFVEMVVKAVVDHPEDVKVERSLDERGVFLQLSINQEDMGKIIGKEGRTAKAIRTLLRIVGAKENERVNLKIMEPEGYERPARAQSDDDDSAPQDEVITEAPTPAADEKSTQKSEEEPDTLPIEEEKATQIV